MGQHIYRPPTAEQAKRHWQSQAPSVWRRPKTKDQGVTIVTSKEHARAIIAAELTEGPQEVYRLKTPPGDFHDPMARMKDFIRLKTQQGLTAEEAYSLCQTPDDLLIYELLYGEMSASQRSNNLAKVTDQVFRRQQEVLKQVNIQKQRDDQKAARLLKARENMRDIAGKGTSE